MKYYKISEKILEELVEAEVRLNALECGGVDNWSWYGEAFLDAIEDFREEYDIPADEDVEMVDLYCAEMKRYNKYLID